MSHTYFDVRRLLAVSTILFASGLQLSGSDPAPGSRHMLIGQLTSVAFEGPGERCARCGPLRAITSLVHVPDRVQLAAAVTQPRSETASGEALPGKEDDLFYNPEHEAQISTGTGSASVGSDNHSPPLRPATSSNVSFTSWPIPQSVFFVYRSADTGAVPQRRVPIATAFVLSVPNVAHRTVARFLVTARHVVDPEWAHCSGRNPASIEVGFNRSAGGVAFETISLENTRGQRYFVPADGTSDIAIIRLDEQLVPGLEAYKLHATPFSLLPTASDLQTMPGDQQVVTASLRDQPEVEPDTFPVSRIGVLPSTLNTTVNIVCGKNSIVRPLGVWLINGSVQRDFSGAPVYTSLVREGKTTPTTVLIGVQAFAWPQDSLAGITPSTALADLVQMALERRTQADFYRGVTP